MTNSVHETAVLGPGVELGDGNTIGPHAVLLGPLVIGDGNWIGPHVTIGGPPEIRDVDHAAAWDGACVGKGVSIGSGNVLREGTTVHQGWYGETTVGDDCFVMNKVYVAHDVVIGDGATLASSTTLAGHVRVGARANLGMNTTVHQRCHVGSGAMVGMAAVVTRSVPPWAKAFGVPARTVGVNAVGMQRAGFAEPAIRWLEDAYVDASALEPGRAPESLREVLGAWAAGAAHRDR